MRAVTKPTLASAVPSATLTGAPNATASGDARNTHAPGRCPAPTSPRCPSSPLASPLVFREILLQFSQHLGESTSATRMPTAGPGRGHRPSHRLTITRRARAAPSRASWPRCLVEATLACREERRPPAPPNRRCHVRQPMGSSAHCCQPGPVRQPGRLLARLPIHTPDEPDTVTVRRSYTMTAIMRPRHVQQAALNGASASRSPLDLHCYSSPSTLKRGPPPPTMRLSTHT